MSLLSQNFKIWRWGCENLNIRFREASLFDAKYNDCMKSWRVESICRLFQNKPKENFRRLEFTVGATSAQTEKETNIYIFLFLGWPGGNHAESRAENAQRILGKKALCALSAHSPRILCALNLKKVPFFLKFQISKNPKILKNLKFQNCQKI